MSGSAAIRGYLIQTMTCLLESITADPPWDQVCIEPAHESDKVDVLWQFPGGSVKAVQVKSSQNQIAKADVLSWASDLETSCTATEYVLHLLGPCSQAVVELGMVGKVRVPPPRVLDLDGLVEQAAHRLDIFFENRGVSRMPPWVRELLVNAVVAKLATYSTKGAFVSRRDFDALLIDWILLLYPNAVNRAIDTQCDLLVDTVFLTVLGIIGSGPVDNDLHVVLPITFVNGGVRTAAIEWVAVKVKSAAGTALFTPVNLVCHKEYVQGGGMLLLNSLHMLSQFSEFPIPPGQTLAVSVHFSREKNDPRYSPIPWSAGPHTIEIYVKYRDRDTPIHSKSLNIDVPADVVSLKSAQTRLVIVQKRHIDI